MRYKHNYRNKMFLNIDIGGEKSEVKRKRRREGGGENKYGVIVRPNVSVLSKHRSQMIRRVQVREKNVKTHRKTYGDG